MIIKLSELDFMIRHIPEADKSMFQASGAESFTPIWIALMIDEEGINFEVSNRTARNQRARLYG